MLFSMLQEAVRVGAGRRALIGRSTSSYRQVFGSASNLVRQLQRRGVGCGSHVAIDTDDPVEFAAAFFAAASCGAIVVDGASAQTGSSKSHGSGSQDSDFILEHGAARVRGEMAPAKLPPRIAIRIARIGVTSSRSTRLRQMGAVLADSSDGSRAAIYRHQVNLSHEAKSLVRALEIDAKDKVLCTLELDRSPGLSVGLIAAIRARAAASFAPANDADAIEDLVARLQPTILVSDCATLLAHVVHRRRLERHLANVRLIVTPRSDLVPQLIEVQSGTKGRLVTFYHRPDTGIIALNTLGGSSDAAGRPLPGVRVSVERNWAVRPSLVAASPTFGSFLYLRSFPRSLHDAWEEVTEPGIPGQIVVQSPATSPTASWGGRCYTNDRGYIDAAGELHLLPDATPSACQARSA